MITKSQIQNYINNFRRRLARYFRPGIGVNCNIFQATAGGAVLEFTLGPDVENDDNFRETSETLPQALSYVEQKAFAGNLSGIAFGGTNTILEPGRIIFIKDGDGEEWTDKAAKRDVGKVVSRLKGSPK